MKYFNTSVITCLLCWVFLLPHLGVSQAIQDSMPSVRMQTRVQKDCILLRWGVDGPLAWHKSNKGGFVLEKYVLSVDGNRLHNPQKVWERTIKADPLETWQDIVEKDNYAAIIAQAIYGESFLVEGSQGELADIVNLSQEIEQRFSFALFAADMSFKAAQKAGWGYVDADVKSNERYIYKVRSALPPEQLTIKSTAALAGLSDYESLPAPIDLQGIFGDKSVIVTWEYELFKTIYTSYNLERSEDGKTFVSLSQEPLVNLNDKPEAPAKRMFYVDSLAQNNKVYHYRVNGISPFGEQGPFSEIISGKGQPVLPFTPRISDFEFTEKPNEAVIKWEFPKEGEAITEKFQLNRAEKDSGPFTVVVDDIPVNQRELRYSNLYPANYFTITAVGKTPGQKKTSFTTLIQPIDSIPPSKPLALTGAIDTLGIVRIKWENNKEQDMLGYRVFRAFNAKEEPSQLTISPIESNKFLDTVEIKSLNSKVYYQVVAVDKRFNHSQMSKVLVLEKPDVIPPTAPIFSNYKVEKGMVKLSWVGSSELEATHILSRKNITDDTEWEEVYKVLDTVQRFTDTNVEANKTYRYSIQAIDKSGLQSLPSTPLTIKVTDLSPPDLIKEVNFNVDRENNYIELFWRVETDRIAEYTLYKQTGEDPPSTWRILPKDSKRVVDYKVTPNDTYKYHLRATLVDGKYSKVKSVAIKF
ncbi:fibronectin type III domain-containing protein [Spongiimicrobium sp. 3-5]|uniref:fibronectin type III domain-containing protein n=1 Tax=Spongiimicrobium sp. 3-5 TaxID=3332596 RepID=UPI00397F678C